MSMEGIQIWKAIRLCSMPEEDDRAPMLVEVPGAGGQEDESGAIRQAGVQNNVVRARVTMPALSQGRHVLTIRAVDPGVVIDRIALPATASR